MAINNPQQNILYYIIMETSLGWVGLSGNGKALSRFVLPEKDKQSILAQLTATIPPGSQFIPADDQFSMLVEKIKDYFNGKLVHFKNQTVDLSGYTFFQRKVLLKTREIAYGTTRTYRWLAKQTGYPRAYRAVGGVMRINPLPLIIPCHRVIGSQGKLTGFSATGGLSLKQKMLVIEGALKEKKGILM